MYEIHLMQTHIVLYTCECHIRANFLGTINSNFIVLCDRCLFKDKQNKTLKKHYVILMEKLIWPYMCKK